MMGAIAISNSPLTTGFRDTGVSEDEEQHLKGARVKYRLPWLPALLEKQPI